MITFDHQISIWKMFCGKQHADSDSVVAHRLRRRSMDAKQAALSVGLRTLASFYKSL